MIDKQIKKIKEIESAIKKTKSAKLKYELGKHLIREKRELKQALIFIKQKKIGNRLSKERRDVDEEKQIHQCK